MAKKYSVNWENEEVVSVEVDGRTYEHPDQIPDAQDRDRILQLISRSLDEEDDSEFDKAFEDFDEEFRELEKQSARFPVLIVAIFLLVAIITLTVAVISGISAGRTVSREASAQGQVVEMVVRKSQGGYDSQGTYEAPQDYYYPVVEFTLPGGTRKTVQLSEGSWPPAYEIGEKVTILYDPEKPIHARIQSASSNIMMWMVPGITGILGLAFLIAAAAVAWFLKPGSAERKTSSGKAGL